MYICIMYIYIYEKVEYLKTNDQRGAKALSALTVTSDGVADKVICRG